MKPTHNIIMLLLATLLGIVVVLSTLFFLNDKIVNVYTVMTVSVVSGVISTIVHKVISRNYLDLIERAKAWMVLYVYINVYMGAAIGILLGALLSWLLFYPFSLIFGHPEQVSWGSSKTHAFELIVLISTLLTTVFCTKYFFAAGIHHIKKRVNPDK